MKSESFDRPQKGDLIAGITVAVLVIPQALAYAEIAGLPAHIGLYAAALPPLGAALLASSRYLQTGPTAMMALLTFGALSQIAQPGTRSYIEAAITLALMVGAIRLLLGAVRAGLNVAYLMSSPALTGFTSAAALLIVASQVGVAVGSDETGSSLLHELWRVVANPSTWSAETVAISITAAVIILGGRKLHRRFPGVLVAVVVGTVASRVLDFGGEVVGELPLSAPNLSVSFDYSDFLRLLIPAGVIALLGFAEVAAISRSFAIQDRERWDPNREFISQGVANVVAAVSGAFPVGGSFSRSSVAKIAGATTRWAGAVTGISVLLFLPFVGVIAPLPRAVLAMIVIVAVSHLIRLTTMFRLAAKTWGQAFVAWGTFVATLVLAPRIELGVVTGIALAATIHFRREALIQVLSQREGTILTLYPSGVLFYGSTSQLDLAFTEQLAAHPVTTKLVVDLKGLGRIDYTGALALKELLDGATMAGLDVAVGNVPTHAKGTIERSWGGEFTHTMWEG